MELPAAAHQNKRTALVTGSNNGIGEAIVRELAKLDFLLVVTGRDGDDIKRVANDCGALSPSGARPLEIQANLQSEDDVRRLFAATMAHFGGRLDLLVNNAGLSTPTPIEDPEASYANFTKTLTVNLNSACLLTLLAAKPLQETAQKFCDGKPTSVVYISSIADEKPLDDYSYSVSKSGLSMLSNCFADKLGPLVRVNCLKPGPVHTKIVERAGISAESFRSVSEHMTPLRRVGLTREIADAVVFLADPERASFISGAQLRIDGGISCASLKF